MNEEGLCVGCGGDCLDIVQCSCTQEISACEECRELGINLVCGACRDRALRVVPVGLFPCRDFMEGEAGMGRDLGEPMSANASVEV